MLLVPDCVCVSVSICVSLCACMCLHHGRGPDGSLDTEDELASALVSMAAASFIRLSLQPPQTHTHFLSHTHTLHCTLTGLHGHPALRLSHFGAVKKLVRNERWAMCG